MKMASMQEEGFYCIPEVQLPSQNRTVYCGLCLASGLAGIIGSSWQAFQWKPFLQHYRDRRKPSPNPMIIISLAAANILACMGVLLRSTLMLTTGPPLAEVRPNSTLYHPLNNNVALITTSNIIEVLNQYFYGVTFMWNIMYAFDVYLQLKNINGAAVFYHAICWSIPALTSVGSIVARHLFPGSPTTCSKGSNLVVHYLFFYSLIIITMLCVPLLFMCCSRVMSKRMRESGLMNNHNWAILAALRKKFMAVVLIFIFCWFSNLVDAVILLTAASTDANPASLAQYFPIWAIEALLNPIQGLLTCLVYGRHMLFWRIARHEGRVLQSEQTIGEATPILYTRNASLLFASE